MPQKIISTNKFLCRSRGRSACVSMWCTSYVCVWFHVHAILRGNSVIRLCDREIVSTLYNNTQGHFHKYIAKAVVSYCFAYSKLNIKQNQNKIVAPVKYGKIFAFTFHSLLHFFNILTWFETKQFKCTNTIFLKGKTSTGYWLYILSLIIPGLQPLSQTP